MYTYLCKYRNSTCIYFKWSGGDSKYSTEVQVLCSSRTVGYNMDYLGIEFCEHASQSQVWARVQGHVRG